VIIVVIVVIVVSVVNQFLARLAFVMRHDGMSNVFVWR
jgi:hypothetical protein